jgi:hypothetical protein
MWEWLLRHARPDLRFKALSYLTDRRDGKPKQAVEVSGELAHSQVPYRDPRLANLSPEELQTLDSLTRKLAAPAQDGLHNQIESNTAIEPEVTVESNPRPMKRPLPVTCCTRCRTPGHSLDFANLPCPRKIDGERCEGTIQGAIGEDDWLECPNCAASGEKSGMRGMLCAQCDGHGWIFDRR